MKTKVYTTLGWMAWQGATIIGKRKLSDNKVKLGAVGTVALVLVAGLVAAKATSSDD
ncbi:MAG TPA: hypothetical protein VFB44_12890 [Thermoleophilaceae bacterium]|nr:hypothetical protein [Thermoleophilaceae bacterium]